MLVLCGLISFGAHAQDSLRTTTLDEVVVTGTKFEVPAEKSGKTIYKITSEELQRSVGKTLADLLNEVPGVQSDGNFGTPGSNLSYYVRGGRNKQTLVLIDGVPLNDPSAINSEYDLRYIPLSQIESVEIFKGGLSTLYGTNAAAGVINIKLKAPTESFSGNVDLAVGSFGKFGQNILLSGTTGKVSILGTVNNVSAEGFSSAQDNDATVTFDKDGFSRQNALLKIGYKATKQFTLNFQGAYEQFKADYDAYEFTDADSHQEYDQVRVGVNPNFQYQKGTVEGKFFYNVNERKFFSAFPSEFQGNNFQGELINRHRFSKIFQTLAGINYQNLSFDQGTTVKSDTATFNVFDPYASLLIDLPAGASVHAGLRLNTHSVYGSQLVYNLNPSVVLNQDGMVRVKIYGSVSTSYITPSLYQLFSIYGNRKLKPEEALNYEAGLSFMHDKLTLTGTWFSRDEKNPIDFVSIFDSEGNYVRGEYRNLTAERNVTGVEISGQYDVNEKIALSANFTTMDTDVDASFYRIPKKKFGASVTYKPVVNLILDVDYNFTGERTTFDFMSFSEITLKQYQLVDVTASYEFLKQKLNLMVGVNNLFDEQFIAIYGYTTAGRNYTAGLRYTF